MKVAVIGAGIAGLACARALAGKADVTVLEAAPAAGGHVHTVDVAGTAVDLGFIVFSRPSYPRFTAMLDELGVASRATAMSFSVSLGTLEWSSASPRGWFAQPTNLARPSHWRFLAAVLRFLHRARRDLTSARGTLDEYLAARRVPTSIRDGFVIPLAAALWSLAPDRCGAFPAATYLAFLDHHGMLRATRPHPWRTIIGGSRTYVRALTAWLAARNISIETNRPASTIHRDARGVTVLADTERRFDRVVLATHADTALSLLASPTADERALLGAFTYSSNRTVLHGDTSFLPRARAAWASWNYTADPDTQRVAVTYSMNHLQGLTGRPYLVTLNPRRAPTAPDHAVTFRHPQLDFAALAAQRDLPRLQGTQRTYYAGAHTGFGFHEDGMRSGIAAADALLADEAA